MSAAPLASAGTVWCAHCHVWERTTPVEIPDSSLKTLDWLLKAGWKQIGTGAIACSNPPVEIKEWYCPGCAKKRGKR
jgi:hypothetical protein